MQRVLSKAIFLPERDLFVAWGVPLKLAYWM